MSRLAKGERRQRGEGAKGRGEEKKFGNHPFAFCLLPFAFCLAVLSALAETPDPILRAMSDELARSREMKFTNLEKPYYINYTLDDADAFSASATLGGLLSSNHTHFRA